MNSNQGDVGRALPLPGSALREALREGYSLAHLRADAIAGTTVGIVALPLSMALAIATGVAPQHGLYTAIVAGLLIALLGGSRCQVSGPTAAFVAILLPIVQKFGFGGLALATAIAGVMLITLGLLRLGRFVQFVPFPVVTGFTAGIAVTIATSQVANLTGMTGVRAQTHWHELVAELLRCASTVDPWDLTVGALAMAVLLWLPRVLPRVPAPLVAVALAAAVAFILKRTGIADVSTIADRFSWTDGAGVQHGGIPAWLPQFRWPWDWPDSAGQTLTLDYDHIKQLVIAGGVICALGAIESLLSAVVADGMAGTRHDPDAELMAQGIGNLVAPFFGGFAATGAIARTATNLKAGARSPLASAIHALFLLVSVLALAPLLGGLPMSALAALLLMVAWRMADVRHVRHMMKTGPRTDVFVMASCFLLTVAFDMVVGVAAGMMLAALLFLRRISELTGTRLVGGTHPDLRAPIPAGVLVYEVDGPLFFGAAERAMTALHSTGRDAKVVVLSLEGVPMIDATGLVNLQSALQKLGTVHARVVLTGLRDNVRQKLQRAGITADDKQMFERPSVGEGVALAGDLLKEAPVVRA